MKKLLPLIIMLTICFAAAGPAHAETVLNETFSDTSQIDLTKTTAKVDTTNQWVQLPEKSLTNAVDVLEDSIGYAVASKDGITLYEMDDSTGKITMNPAYSCPWATDATGVSLRQDNLNIWAITDTSLAYYKFSGFGMSDDPALKTTGLVNVISVAAIKNKDAALILQDQAGKAVVSRYEEIGGSLEKTLEIKPDIYDPVAISMVGNSLDFRLFTRNASYYFLYDDATGNYIEDPTKKITGLIDIISASSDTAGSAVLTESDLGYYMDDAEGGAARVDAFSVGPVDKPLTVSLKPGAYEMVFAGESGEVQYWIYDDAGDKMVRVPDLETTGLEFNKGYAHPRQYVSKVLTTDTEYDAVFLTAVNDVPDATSIKYYVSSDGGSSFNEVTLSTWCPVPKGNRFVVKAVLDTTDEQKTPKILQLNLQVEEDFQITGSVTPYPAERGRKVLISATVTRLTNPDEEVAMDVMRTTYPLEEKADGTPALPDGQSPVTRDMTYNAERRRWEHIFTVPEKTVDGYWPDDGVYQVKITAIKGSTQKELILNMEIKGHILNRLIIKTLTW